MLLELGSGRHVIGQPADGPGDRAVKILLMVSGNEFKLLEVYFQCWREVFFFSLFVLWFFFFTGSVKTPAKSVRWAVWWGARRGPRRRLIWVLRCRRHRVQTDSHGSPGCGTPFSASPRGRSPPPGSRPAPSWRRSGSYPSNWQERRGQH